MLSVMAKAGGWYEEHVFNPLMDRALRIDRIAALRTELLAGLRGDVVEVGLGTGLNLFHYRRGTRVRAVAREAHLDRRAVQRAHSGGVELAHVRGDAQALPFEDRSVGSLVCTFVLCSVDDPARALRELARVLAPRGELYLIEHVVSPRPVERFVQRALTPIHRHWSCGCRLDRDLAAAARAAGLDTGSLVLVRSNALPFPASQLLCGVARRAGHLVASA